MSWSCNCETQTLYGDPPCPIVDSDGFRHSRDRCETLHPETIGVDIPEWFAAGPPEPVSEPALEPGRARFVDVEWRTRAAAAHNERPIPAADAPRVPTGGDSFVADTQPTLRDQFAMHAPNWMTQNPGGRLGVSLAAAAAYAWADAMLTARKLKEGK